MNNKNLVALSMDELISVTGGDSPSCAVHGFVFGLAGASMIVTGMFGAIVAGVAFYNAYQAGCFK